MMKRLKLKLTVTMKYSCHIMKNTLVKISLTNSKKTDNDVLAMP